MRQIPTEEYFSAALWQVVLYRVLSFIIFMIGINLLMIKEAGNLLFLVPLLFLIAISMFFYTRLKLIISNENIRLTGWLKPHHMVWSDITKVDMVSLGKYKTPTATITTPTENWIYIKVSIFNPNSKEF